MIPPLNLPLFIFHSSVLVILALPVGQQQAPESRIMSLALEHTQTGGTLLRQRRITSSRDKADYALISYIRL